MAQMEIAMPGTEIMSDDDQRQQQEIERERYEASMVAIAECIRKGVSSLAIATLAWECGLRPQDIDQINRKEAA